MSLIMSEMRTAPCRGPALDICDYHGDFVQSNYTLATILEFIQD
jgi:hypothetical protein